MERARGKKLVRVYVRMVRVMRFKVEYVPEETC